MYSLSSNPSVKQGCCPILQPVRVPGQADARDGQQDKGVDIPARARGRLPGPRATGRQRHRRRLPGGARSAPSAQLRLLCSCVRGVVSNSPNACLLRGEEADINRIHIMVESDQLIDACAGCQGFLRP